MNFSDGFYLPMLYGYKYIFFKQAQPALGIICLKLVKYGMIC